MKSLIALTALVLSFVASAAGIDQVCLDRNGKELDTSLATVTRIVYGHGNRPQIYVTGKIISIQGEDHNGLPHQKFKLQVSNDIILDIVTNLDFGRIPVAVGKQISICGEFKNVGKGMVHWTHFDPHGGHPDGFSIIDGKLYGDKEEN